MTATSKSNKIDLLFYYLMIAYISKHKQDDYKGLVINQEWAQPRV
jgi:hypothetical protein